MSIYTAYTVKDLIKELKKLSPDASVEFECPKRLPADREPVDGARVFVTSVEEVWYNEPENKWVVLK